MTAKKAPAAKKTVAKKTAAKKTASSTSARAAAKKTTAKRPASDVVTGAEAPDARQNYKPQDVGTNKDDEPVERVATAPPNPVVSAADPSGLQPEDSKSAESIAQEIVNGSRQWNTGRDRDELLKRAGHDPEEVRRAVSRLRAKARREATR